MTRAGGSEPLVSVISPFLDPGPHLTEAIDSVRAQTLPCWELLLIDDGSSDGSTELAAAAARSDPRIRLVPATPGRKGAAAARNRGMAEARGEYIAFLDADDLFEPDKLRSELEALAAHPEAMTVYGPTTWWWPGRRRWIEPMWREAGVVHPPESLVEHVLLLQEGHVPCTCGVLVRREAIDEVGGFEEAFRLYEDQTLWAKLFLRYPVFVVDAANAIYRQHAGSTSARAAAAADDGDDAYNPDVARVAFIDWVDAYARMNKLMTPTLERAVRLALAPYVGRRVRLSLGDRVDLVLLRVREMWRNRVDRWRSKSAGARG